MGLMQITLMEITIGHELYIWPKTVRKRILNIQLQLIYMSHKKN